MTTTRVCPQCGKPLSGDAPQGLCPECLLKAALPGQSALESTATGLDDASSGTAIAPESGVRLKYFGDYELVEEIARGGMGVVWKARQSSLNRDVALKMIRAGALASPEEVERFLREAEAAANLQHPNIVAIHEVGEHGGQHYFSMDYVAGRDLGALVKEGPLSPQSAARYVKIIAEAIHFAHQRGTLHRDLKPQNVLIDAADQPRITDFGLAKFIKDDSRMTQPGVVMGSPSYMPPEQAEGRNGDVGPPSDVYSLGAILYELLTGRPPFRGATALATMREVMEVEPVAPRKLKADIPLDLETICLKCLEKSQSARYPTARALAEELDRFLKGEPIQARPVSAVRKVLSWTRRHPGTLAALATLVIVALAFGVFYLFEENAFLLAQQANPSLVRVRGPRYQSMRNWGIFSCLFSMSAGGWLFIIVLRRARGASKDLLDLEWRYRPLQPLDRLTRSIAVGGGLILIACGVMCLTKTVDAYVWEGEFSPADLGSVYLPIFFGLATLGMVVRDHGLLRYGPASRHLTAEQLEPIRCAMEGYNMIDAIKHYRRAVPDAGLAESSEYVHRLAASLRAQHPGKFTPPPLSSAFFDWKAVGKCVLIGSVVLGALWFVRPPSHPASAVSQFAYSLLFIMGTMAGLGVKGYWKLLLLAPSLVGMILSETILPRLTESPSHSIGPYLCGVCFGMFLMAYAFNFARPKKA
jgi:tRNA A-37 threonylcarbamoyl transferase component Bud32